MSTLPAKVLGITAPASAGAGSVVPVRITGLAKSETYAFTLGGPTLASGSAKSTAALDVNVPLGNTAVGAHTLVVTGQAANRSGSCPLEVVDGGVVIETKQK